ncbi:MAG: hypothetical protein FJY37_09450 [Betaproteobacteria bacterium]|nr:hypothetical protein [Betaproteobacteria bacterium]
MSGLRLIPVLSSCLLLMACAHGLVRGGPERVTVGADIVVQRQGSQLHYQGELTAQGLAALRDFAEGRVVQSLVITSSGGEINVGMDFGEWVFARGLNVEVSKYCLSSCANYVFPAAWQKFLPTGGRWWPGMAVHASATCPTNWYRWSMNRCRRCR